MPVLTHRTSDPSLPRNNWHRPFELPPILSLSYEDHSSWILNDSIWTSSLNFETIQSLSSTSIPELTQNGPLIPMGYSDIWDASMSQIWEIFGFAFFSTRTIIHLPAIMASPRPFTMSGYNTTGPDSQSMSRTTASRTQLVPVPNLCTTDPTDFLNSLRSLRSLGIQYPWIS